MPVTFEASRAATAALLQALRALRTCTELITEEQAQALLARVLESLEPGAILVSAPCGPMVLPTDFAPNDGRFDFVALGQPGLAYTAALEPLAGRLESLVGLAQVSDAVRRANGQLTVNFAGETEVGWDGQAAVRDSLSTPVWLTERWDTHSGQAVVLLPLGYSGDPKTDPGLPVRDALVALYDDWLDANPDATVSNACTALGYALTEREHEALSQLRAGR